MSTNGAFQQGNINTHAILHEDGGADEIDITALAGYTAPSNIWTDSGTYLKPVGDGDNIRVYDGSAYSELTESVLALQERSDAPSTVTGHFQVYGKEISGLGGTNIAPTMTGFSTPSPYSVEESGELYGGGFEGWRAFDHGDDNTNSLWTDEVTGLPAWLLLDFSEAKKINAYAIKPYNNARAPKTWTLQGSNDKSNWTTIDTQTNITTWSSYTYNNYNLVNTVEYRYYKINITANNGDATYIQLAEIAMYAPAYTFHVKLPDGTEKTVTLT